MALTRDVGETVGARSERDPEFRRAVVQEAIECLLNNEVEVGKALLKVLLRQRGKRASG